LESRTPAKLGWHEVNKCRSFAQPILAAAKPSGLAALGDTTELLLSERVTNAIRATGRLTLPVVWLVLRRSERQSRMGYDRPVNALVTVAGDGVPSPEGGSKAVDLLVGKSPKSARLSPPRAHNGPGSKEAV
jgi:hypothetical protein